MADPEEGITAGGAIRTSVHEPHLDDRPSAGRQSVPKHDGVEDALADDGVVTAVVERFRSLIGLWQE